MGTARRARVYCVGAAKTGTHSVAEMFDRSVRSGHEPEGRKLLAKVLDRAEGRISETDLRAFLVKRDRRLRLDVDSSQLNFFVLDVLASEYSDARFVLTIRDCYSWLDSFVNHTLRHSPDAQWVRYRDLRFRPDAYPHAVEERALYDRGLYSLDSYLSYWSRHNQHVISHLDSARLFVVKTDEITQRADEIAAFSGLPSAAIRFDRSHAFQGTHKLDVLNEIDRHFLEKKVRDWCIPLMSRFFPEIRSLDDAQI